MKNDELGGQVAGVGARGTREMHTGFRWGILNEEDSLEDTGRIILKWIFRKRDVGAWTGLIWLRTGTDGRLLY
jgi:hypothetical protein